MMLSKNFIILTNSLCLGMGYGVGYIFDHSYSNVKLDCAKKLGKLGRFKNISRVRNDPFFARKIGLKSRSLHWHVRCII